MKVRKEKLEVGKVDDVDTAALPPGVDSVDRQKKLEADKKYTVLLAFFGEVSVGLVSDVAALYGKVYPGCVALDGSHRISRKLGATLCLARSRSVWDFDMTQHQADSVCIACWAWEQVKMSEQVLFAAQE